MGHHTKANLLAARERLGPDLHLYGEGWSFGEVADDALFVAASQKNMAGTGIGTFNDRLRDAVRGGGPHDEDPRIAGLRHRARGRAERGARARSGADPAGLCAAGLRRVARGRDRLRRRARQRDAVRHARAQAAAGDLDGRPRAHEHARARDHRRSARARASGTRAPTCCARSRSTATPTTRATGSTGSTGRRRESTWGSGLPPAWDNEAALAVHAPAARRPGAQAAAASTSATARERAHELLRIRFSSPLFRLGDPERDPRARDVRRAARRA